MFLFIVVLLVVLIIYLFYKLRQIKIKYSSLIEVDRYVDEQNKIVKKIKNEIEENKKIVLEEKEKLKKINTIKLELESEILELEENNELQEFGVYKPKHALDTSEEYKSKLDEIYIEQKNMIAEKTAAICDTEWTVGNSKAQGRKMTNENLKLMLRAFNGEADLSIAKVKYNNINAMSKRIEKAKTLINKLGATNRCSISDRYFYLKNKELELTHEYHLKLQEEKEEQQRIREEMREEDKAQKEFEKAIKDAELEEKRNLKALEQARQEYKKTMSEKTQKEKDEFLEKIRKLEEQLDLSLQLKARAISQAQLTKAGHVYVISNIGSFGENIYKIGMTRRLEPEDRIRELSSASVPFPFDIHAMIYSENAPGLENQIHHEFKEKSVNLINFKKEFFEVKLEEVEDFIKENNGDFKLTKIAIAEQFRQTEQLKKEQLKIESVEEKNRIEDLINSI